MKKILLLLLICNSVFAQNKNQTLDENKNLVMYENFEIEDNIIVWKKVFEIENVDILNDLRENLKLKFNKDNSGSVKDLSLNCKGTSVQLAANFNLDFRVDIKEGKYRIMATNFIFESPMQFSSGMISTSRQSYNLEYFIVKKNNTFRKNFQVKADLECMNEVLTSLFTIKPILENDDKW